MAVVVHRPLGAWSLNHQCVVQWCLECMAAGGGGGMEQRHWQQLIIVAAGLMVFVIF